MINYVDAHSDTFFKIIYENAGSFEKQNPELQITLPGLKKAGTLLQTFAIFAEDKNNIDYMKSAFLNISSFTLESINKNSKHIKFVESVNEVFLNRADNIISAIMSVEGAGFIEHPSHVALLKKIGVKMLSLTWNYENNLAFGQKVNQTSGLKKLGHDVVLECRKNNIVVDVSHINYKGFFDIAELMENTPFIASHSNAYRICATPRNLKDEQLKAIKESKGVIGINLYPEIVSNKKNVNIDDVIEHIDYIADRIGIDYIGLGTDFDGIEKTPEGLENVTKIQSLFERLAERGYKNDDIVKIASSNFLRVFNQVWENL